LNVFAPFRLLVMAHPRLFAIAVLLAAAAPAAAQNAAPSPEEAARLEREAEAARAEAARLATQSSAAAAEIERLQLALVEAARGREEAERATLALERRLEELAGEEVSLSAQVDVDRAALADVLAALARIERSRPPAALVHGQDLVDAARAAGLLAEVAPALEARAEVAFARIEALERLRGVIAVDRAALRRSEAEFATERAAVSALIAERTAEIERLEAAAAREAEDAEALASQAGTLRELLAALEARAGEYEPDTRRAARDEIPTPRRKPRGEEIGAAPLPFTPATGRFADAQGALAPPAAGRIVARFGEVVGGAPRAGMTIRTRRQAQVTAPFDARIEYAGAFRGYGRLLILSVGDDYHIVLAGLSTLYGVAGQTVLAGEPIGEMADASNPAPDLYVEIRKEGQPIDPGPWWRDDD
jgi:septal ring factor EnvC (AmiA/AmiB activator)